MDDEHFPLDPSLLLQDKYVEYEPYAVFNLFFTDELINHIVDSTNENLERIRNSLNFVASVKRRMTFYQPLTANEFRVFLGMKINFNFLNTNRIRGINT